MQFRRKRKGEAVTFAMIALILGILAVATGFVNFEMPTFGDDEEDKEDEEEKSEDEIIADTKSTINIENLHLDSPVTPVTPQYTPVVEEDDCPTTEASTLEIRVRNMLSDSGADIAAEVYVASMSGTVMTSIQTDTDSGYESATIDCGNTLKLYVKGNNTINSLIKKIITIEGSDATLNADGTVDIVVNSRTEKVMIYVDKRDEMEYAVFDGSNTKIYNESETTAGGYQKTTVVPLFKTTTSNSTAMTFAANTVLRYQLYMRSASSETNMQDMGGFVLVDGGSAAGTYLYTPGATFDGTELKNSKADRLLEQLTIDENTAYSEYEFAYFLPYKDGSNFKVLTTSTGQELVGTKNNIYNDQKILSLVFKATSNDPINDLKVAQTFRGAYKTQNDQMAVAAVDDTSTHAQIHRLEYCQFDIS